MAVIAGKVAPRFMGAYNSSTTYQFYDAVTYGNKLYFCKTSGTVGKTPSGATDNYWFLSLDGTFADAASLGGETATQWQKKLDNIQSTVSGATSGTGWYRVAELATTSFIDSPSCFITLKRTGSKDEVVVLRLDVTVNTQRFALLSSLNNAQYLTAVRLTTDNAKTYVEIYHANAVAFNYHVSILDFASRTVPWKAIAPTATAEEVDGVTVTTTYDIPANASPVTDLDLKQFDGTETLTTSILAKALTLPIGNYEYRIGGDSYTGSDLPSYWYKFSDATVKVRDASTIEVIVWGVNVGGSVSVPIVNYYNGSAWSGWNIFATTEDLANYLPLTGGAQYKADYLYNYLRTDLRNVLYGIDDKGVLLVLDQTNGKQIIQSTASGTTNFYGTLQGTATGNLPITGGRIDKADSVPLKLNNTNSVLSLLEFMGIGGRLGLLGFNGADNPIFYNTSGSELPLLHSGNSAKVAIQSTAPSDTNSLWVDTANKVTKAYIDGAWTQVA